ncbi:MAG: T9SS type A sorting domain-containing protein [Flavobacteriales bacterium]|nr:T9SS type A sorting domain-containing protein [Flavobacteriales bacterium]
MKTRITVLLIAFLLSLFSFSQDNDRVAPIEIGTSEEMYEIPSLASRINDLIPYVDKTQVMQDGKATPDDIVAGKGSTGEDLLAKDPGELYQKIQGKTPSIVFNAAFTSSSPTDPAGAVGPNHYVAVFNTGFRVFDKDGNALTEQLAPGNVFGVGSYCCDLTVSYDAAADRFVMSILGNGWTVAVSQGPDPVNDGWYVYNWGTGSDYQKLSIWSDGYYVTDNPPYLHILERDAMLSGDQTAQFVDFPLPGLPGSGFRSPQAFNITDDNLPAAGSAPIVFMADDGWAGVSSDHLKVWTADVDWNTPSNSSISASPQEISTTPFISIFDGGSWDNLQQPGGSAIDALQSTIMNQAQFRKFSSHNSAILNFVVNISGDATNLAGVRWFELRQDGDGQPWSLYQEGTYAAPDGKHAWNASMAMDLQGNIGLGYSGMGGNNNQFVSSYYTGRYASDALGTMSIAEELIAAGNGNIPGIRFGDYSKLAVDPSNDKAFWFNNEYISGSRANVVGVFQIAANFANDVGVVNIDSPTSGTLTSTEDVTVTIFNYGENDASNFDVTYQVDGGTTITETYTGTIGSALTDQFTFSATTDMSTVGSTYAITASTAMSGDEDNTNDSYTTDVSHLNANDIGVSAISSPSSGTNLSATEQVTVTITNFGGGTQTNFDVTIDLDGTIVTETVAGPLEGNSTIDYTFIYLADLSAFGSYTITAYTSLASDYDNSNDSITVTVNNANCQPEGDMSFGDGIHLFQLGDIDNASGEGGTGYQDFTNLSTDLEQGSTNTLTLATGYGNQYFRVWIDFNDDFVFSLDELVVDNYVLGVGGGAGTYQGNTALVVPADAALGQHIMRAKTNWNAGVPDDACEETTYGETEDYTVNIVTSLGIDDLNQNSEFSVISLGNNQFDVNLNSPYVGKIELTVYNALGQRMVFHRFENTGTFNYALDMSYVAKGIYLVKVGNNSFGKVQKIIVK